MRILIGCLILSGLILWLRHPRVPAFTDENCIRAMVGEYAVNDYYGMTLLAHALRNRGTLKGVYGFYAKHIKTEPKEIWMTASLAWFESKNFIDPVQGAKEWRSRQDIHRGKVPHKMKLIKVYSGMYYFKPIKKGE